MSQPPFEDTLLRSLAAEYRRYKALAEAALAQVPEARLSESGPAGGNSLAVICWHLSGNLRSRFTDFLDGDGEKPWRHRDEEFAAREVSRTGLLAKWEQGWAMLLGTLDTLTDADLARSVVIRGESLPVHEALHRSLAHTSYHVGQIVYLAHALCGDAWRYLSIPPGGSAQYNADPRFERAVAHTGGLRDAARPDAALAEVEAATAEFHQALRTNDAAKLFAYVAEDVVMTPPGEGPVCGKEAMQAWYAGFLSQVRTTSLTLADREVFVGTGWAVEKGAHEWVVEPVGGGEAVVDHGNYMQVWRRAPDGRWLFAREIWNSAAPPTAGQAS
jgi:uncharacterized protein (TIGR02246 family)